MLDPNSCKSCGAALDGDLRAPQWQCAYCQTTNYNTILLQKRIREIDFSKRNNLFQLGMAAYEARDYSSAIAKLEVSLTEDSGNGDAWVYLAMAASKLANASNFKDSIAKITTYLDRAVDCSTDVDLPSIAKNGCANSLAAVAERIGRKHLQDAQKALNAFGTTDPARASRVSHSELDALFEQAASMFALNPNDLAITSKIAVLVLKADGLCNGSHPHAQTVSDARSLIDTLKAQNQSLYTEAQQELMSSKDKQNAGCTTTALYTLTIFLAPFALWWFSQTMLLR